MKLAFIGAGKMAEAIIARLGDKKYISAADVSRERLKTLASKYKVKTQADNCSAFESAEVVILAVKPQQMSDVLDEVRGTG